MWRMCGFASVTQPCRDGNKIVLLDRLSIHDSPIIFRIRIPFCTETKDDGSLIKAYLFLYSGKLAVCHKLTEKTYAHCP
jgi:hypothetical protein